MLIEFQVQNFRSFRDRQILSMVASSFAEHVQANTFQSGLKGFGRFLRSAALYGPNAAGKTNLLRAIQFVQTFVVNSAATTAGTQYPYSSFKFSNATREAASQFQIAFVQHGIRYEYGITMGPKRIEKERLVEYVHSRGRVMFNRSYDNESDQYIWEFSSFLKGPRSVWSDSTRPDALFLSTAVQLNSKQLIPVFEWFQKRLVVVVGPTKLNQSLTLQLLDRPDGKARLLPFLREADLGIADVKTQRERVPTDGGLVVGGLLDVQPIGASVVKVTLSHLTDDPNKPAELDFAEESHGTQVLFRNAGAWLNVTANGEVLLVDEIDASLHPLLVRFLIRRFHSDKTNQHNAQLIFTTHNTTLLDQELLRRDQIWFVEKERDGASRLYPLTDFSPRSDELIERWYMRGRYGALPVLPHIDGDE